MRVLVLGAGTSGKAAAGLAYRQGHDVTVYDRDLASVAPLRSFAEAHAGVWHESLLAPVDLVITSPGFQEGSAPIQDTLARGIPLWSEMEFAARRLEAPYVAVTGTNGKTTVTAATAEMLVAAGLPAVAAGNIGTALADVADKASGPVVVEASSFQLRFIESFHPIAAAVLNVAPDHLDWHQSMAAYEAAKARIFENQSEMDLLVFDTDDPGARDLVAGSRSTRLPISGERRPRGGNGPEGDALIVGEVRYAKPDLDPAYIADLTAAATLADFMGATRDGIGAVLDSFVPGPNRRELIGMWDDVSWVNDSKATNPHSAVAAAKAYESVVLIAGGRNKGLDLAPLAVVPTIKALVAIGESAPELQRLASGVPTSIASGIDEAVAQADRAAEPGDTVLLAPGCASFDMFTSYEERGSAFALAVRSRKDPPGGQ